MVICSPPTVVVSTPRSRSRSYKTVCSQTMQHRMEGEQRLVTQHKTTQQHTTQQHNNTQRAPTNVTPARTRDVVVSSSAPLCVRVRCCVVGGKVTMLRCQFSNNLGQSGAGLTFNAATGTQTHNNGTYTLHRTHPAAHLHTSADIAPVSDLCVALRCCVVLWCCQVLLPAVPSGRTSPLPMVRTSRSRRRPR